MHEAHASASPLRPQASVYDADAALAWRLAELHFDPGRRLLRRGSARQSLTPKAAQVLQVLVEHWPETVSRQLLLDEIWADADVSDAIVTDAVRSLRRAIKALGASPALIRTVPKQGYALECPPQRDSLRSLPRQPRAAFRRWPLTALLMVVLSLLGYALVNLDRWRMTSAPVEQAQLSGADNPYYIQGRRFYDRYLAADNQRAIEILRSGLDKHPDQPWLLAALAEASAQQFDAFGQPLHWAKEGRELALKAVALAPQLGIAHRASGLTAAVLGDHVAARKAYARAIELDPGDYRARSNLAFIHLSYGQIEQALPLYLAVSQDQPSNPKTHSFIALCYAALGLYERAERRFQLAEELGLSAPEDRYEYVQMLAYSGQPKRALALLDQLEDSATPASFLRMSGYSRALAGDSTGASAAYAQLFALDPVSEYWLDEAAARWRALDNAPATLQQRSDQSLARALQRGINGLPHPAMRHEVAMRLFADEQPQQALQWLQAALEAGWINPDQTRAEPAVRGLRGAAAAKVAALLERIERRRQRLAEQAPLDPIEALASSD